MRDLRIEKTRIPGLLVVRLALQHNDDGWFMEDWHRAKMVALGLPDFRPVQHNLTHLVSRGITRGFLAEPWDRLVAVTQGRAMGAWVDLRPGVGFGHTHGCDLEPGTAVFVPRGVANAHQVLEDATTLAYLLEHHWTPQARDRASSVDPFDPALAIPWPIGRERAIVAHRDLMHPRLADAAPMPPRRMLVVGTETRLGRALVAELPDAHGLASAALVPDGPDAVDLSAYDTIISAHGETGGGMPQIAGPREIRAAAAARTHQLTDIARRHGLRYVHVTTDCIFERLAPEYAEDEPLSLTDPRSQPAAVAEIVAAGAHRHLIVRTSWVIGRDDSFVDTMVTAKRRGRRPEVSDELGRLTFADQLAAGITHLLDVGAPSGTYNVTGDGPVVSWVDVARRIFQLAGGDPDDVRAVTSPQAVAPETVPPSVLNLARLEATGFRPQNSWLELDNRVGATGVAGRTPDAGDAVTLPDASGPRPFRVLFVCTANICRSAYAAVVAQQLVPAGVEVASAGVKALVGEGMDPPLARLVGDRGDPSLHRARQLTRDMMAQSDLIITMDTDHRRYILDEWPELGRKAYVIGSVAREMARLPEDVTFETLIDHLWRHRSAQPDDGVPDPFRRGDAAAEATARTIDRHLEAIVGGLKALSGRAATL